MNAAGATWQHTPKGKVHDYRDQDRAFCGKRHVHYIGRTKSGFPKMVDKPVTCERCLELHPLPAQESRGE